MKQLSFLLFLPCFLFGQDNYSPDYDSIISFYRALDKKYPEALLLESGKSDIGKPIHLFILSKDADFNPGSLRKKNKLFLLVNNGIHPGEPDGINACMELSRDLLSRKSIPSTMVILIIPVYNVDGALNRSCCSRANQNGPEAYGFRGNAKNLDLNRDFIKCDSENAATFSMLFQSWNPDIFVDTHVSNGADYQYTLTLITTQKDKLNPHLSSFVNQKMEPALYDACSKKGFPVAPYVNTSGKTPESGIVGFMETPRYSTGYAALFNCIGFVTETHMLKPFKQRVKATRVFLDELINYANKNAEAIMEVRKKAQESLASQKQFCLSWKLDTSNFSYFKFRGYEPEYKTSEISGKPRLFYNQKKPFEKNIPFFNNYTPQNCVSIPDFYLVPQAWKAVIDKLKINQVPIRILTRDTLIKAEVYKITQWNSLKSPYEGHFLHHSVKTEKETREIKCYAGDLLVPTGNIKTRYVVETLEPEGPDSFFAWNFFDPILQQKEWFSDYVFEDLALEFLKKNPQLKADLEKAKKENPDQFKDPDSELYFIYRNSPWFEKSYMIYPVARIFSR